MEETLSRLRVQLEQQEWPDIYLFKFIVPNEKEKIAQVTVLFNDSSDLVMHPSRTGKYMSVSAKELMLDVDSIIKVYLEAGKIEGLIAL